MNYLLLIDDIFYIYIFKYLNIYETTQFYLILQSYNLNKRIDNIFKIATLNKYKNYNYNNEMLSRINWYQQYIHLFTIDEENKKRRPFNMDFDGDF